MGKKKNKKIIYELPEPTKVVLNGVELTVYGNETIDVLNIADASEDYLKKFGANKNLYRVVPSLQDGMKPVLRRLIYVWWLNEHKPQSVKSDTMRKMDFNKGKMIVSNVMKLHPHSESGAEAMFGRMGQTFSNNVMLIDTQGSFGNMNLAEAGAGRYIKAKLSEYTIDCFFSDFDDYCIPMKVSYDGRTMEPEYLPAKYPHILFNPQFAGIGIGLASNIPPFNVAEVLEATIQLIKDPDSKILLIPDIPTGVDLVDNGEFKTINKTGKGKIVMRANAEIDYKENTIKITTLPINTKSRMVIQKILELKKERKEFEEITNICDSTLQDKVDIVFQLKKDANPDKVLKKLYSKKTGLQEPFSVVLTIIDDYKDDSLSTKDLLLQWIDYRRDAVSAMFMNKYQRQIERIHTLDIFIKVFSKENIDDAVKIAKASNNKKETVEKFMKRFKINSIQATALADMHVYQFNKDSYERFKEERKDLKEESEKIRAVLLSEKKLDEYIIAQLEEGIKKYGRPRLSKIVRDESDNGSIPDVDYLVGITNNGMVKKIPAKVYTSIGNVGNNHDGLSVMLINNKESLLILDETGRLSKVAVSALPDMKFEDTGVELSKYIGQFSNVKAIMELPNKSLLKKDTDLYILIITEQGYSKMVSMTEFAKMKSSLSAISLTKGDKVADAIFVRAGSLKDIIFYTNKGNGMRLKNEEFRTYGASARGLKMVQLNDDERVVGVCRISVTKGNLVYITNKGNMKLTELKYFPVMKRNDALLPLIALGANEKLIGVSTVAKDDLIRLYCSKSDWLDVNANDIPLKARMAKGSKICPVPKGDTIVAFKIFRK